MNKFCAIHNLPNGRTGRYYFTSRSIQRYAAKAELAERFPHMDITAVYKEGDKGY